MPTPQTLPLRRAFLSWLRDSVSRRGWLRTVADAVSNAFELARDYTPQRRRLRYGDIEFDCDHRVDTTWANLPLATRLREIFTQGQYQPVDPAIFHESIAGLAIDFREFVFVDLGSGKGRALLLASNYPFRSIVGVEIIPELHAIAEQNFHKYKSEKQRCFHLQSWCGDARHFTFPPQPVLLYLFNPFPEHVLLDVLARFQESLRMHPRKAVLVYHNPLLEHVFDRQPWLRRITGKQEYVIYEGRSGAG